MIVASEASCEWCNLTEEDKRYVLYEDEYWMVFLADKQDYIGRIILVLKRHCGSLSELSEKEWMDFHGLIQRVEKCTETVMGSEVCNWSCLMNNFYKAENPNPHLHVHCRPRTKKQLVINGSTYSDAEFGHHYALRKESTLTKEDMTTLYCELKEAF